MTKSAIVGVDVGGTFTDILLFDEIQQIYRTAKVPTTPDDQSVAFIAGIDAVTDDIAAVHSIVHGTTVATNALLERKGAKAGLITTKGFRDVLEMRRRDRPTTWGLRGQFKPLIERTERLEVPERIRADGSIHTPFDESAFLTALETLRETGIQSLAICFINAYANPVHERQAQDLARAHAPNLPVTVSSDLLPEIREFERTSTVAMNAYVQPVVSRYLRKLQKRLTARSMTGAFMVVQSNGGMTLAATAGDHAIHTALSGPAAGVIAGAAIAQQAGFPNAITCDMGGTSFDVSLIVNGQSSRIAETAVDFGLVIRTPMIEINTIGAGGGSIAWLDGGGLLNIGPDSAGADPGPACYGRGNHRPTVTDANLLLGRINPLRPLGADDDARLDIGAAEQAITRHIAGPLQLDAIEAAEAVVKVANARMAAAIRLVTVERGHDPRGFVAIPFGGGGALHAGALLSDVGLQKALVPRFPGITSALGCAIADMRYDFVQTVNTALQDVDITQLRQQITRLCDRGFARLHSAGIEFAKQSIIVEFDMSYAGQSHTLAVPVAQHAPSPPGPTADSLQQAFEQTYLQQYGRLLSGLPIRILSLRVATVGHRRPIDLRLFAPASGADAEAAKTGKRNLYAAGHWHDTPVFDRLQLPAGFRIQGPALLEQPDTTIFIDPGLEGTVDSFGNLILSPMETVPHG